VETKSLLLGESATPATQQIIERELVGAGIERVIHLRTLYLGPDELMVAAKIAMPAVATLAAVARETDNAEARVRAAVPEVTLMYLEPDVDGRAG
jgi:divalent metal cation (Fe/Co/Zn/Cd) transporter